MGIYGPSAATGLGLGGATVWYTGASWLWMFLIVFTMISVVFAFERALPKFSVTRVSTPRQVWARESIDRHSQRPCKPRFAKRNERFNSRRS